MPSPNAKIRLTATLSAGGGFQLLSPAPGDFLATPLGLSGPRSAGSVTDLNGDGRADIILGTPGSDDKAANAGRIFVTLGAAVPGSVQDVSHGTPDVMVIDGARAGDMAGFAVGGISDLNGDGLGEVLVGAPGMAVGTASDAGAGFVVWGAATGTGNAVDLLDPFSGAGGGYVLRGQAAGDMAGYAMAASADMNGDGRAEVLIGAPGQDAGGSDAGAAYVVWGRASETPVLLSNVAAGTGGFRILGAAAGDRIGEVIATLADQGGDARPEILLGSAAALGGAGAVWVVDGQASGATVRLASLTAGYRITGSAGDGAGASVADAGDINGDGRHDILVGSASGTSAWLVYGQSGHSDVLLSDVSAGIGGVQITGSNLAGLTVLGNVDLNGDGVSDLVLGTPHDAEGGTNAGAVFVIWGDQMYRPINLDEVGLGIGGVKIVGAAGSLTGTSVALAGDQDGDGRIDLAILAPGQGAALDVLYTPDWVVDPTVYGSAASDMIGAGYGGLHHAIGAGADSVMGLAGDDTLSTGAGNDTLDGGLGADLLAGGAGDDTYLVDVAGDVVREAAGGGTDTVIAARNFTLTAQIENLTLTGAARSGTGNALANVITGTDFGDTLSGAAGDDTLVGGLGNDTYLVAQVGDILTEAAGGGTDVVRASIDWTLGANLENLVLGGLALSGTGNELGNTITGNARGNTLDGAAGADTLIGLGGNDLYSLDSILDRVVEVDGGGRDTVRASVDVVLADWVEALELTAPGHRGTGNALANTLTGSSGADTLDGAAGLDTLAGGTGNDTYLVADAGDRTIELAAAGHDAVIASIDWVLASNIEDLTLTGAAHVGTGNSLANLITGTSGADTLDGRGGADTMAGGAGDDLYRIDARGDVVTELAGGGADTIEASVSATLVDGVETLVLTRAGLTGTGTASADHLIGSTGAEHLIGLGGNDTLDGGAGADTMTGGAGDDTYLIDDLGDTIIEDAGGGTDVAVLMRDGLTVNGDVEIIRLGGAAHSLTGSSGANTLEGGSGNDSLDGGAGDDRILAGDGDDVITATSGHDTVSGGSGDDRYVIHGGAVEIEDFLGHDTLDASESTTNDHIDLSGETETEIEGHLVHVTPGGSTISPLDVQLLQDLTGSFGDDIATVRGLVPQIVSAIQAVQADSVFGVSSFIDRPVSPFGAPGEWVYQLEQAMSADGATLAATYARLVNLSGADAPEAQLDALMQLALHATEAGYRASSARFVVLFTDAPFHVAGDGAAAGITTPNNGDGVLIGGGLGEDYALIAQVRDALVAANIIPIFAIAGGYEATYQDLATQLGRGTVVTLSANSSNIVDAITAGMAAATTSHIEDALGGAGDDTILGGADANGLAGNAGADHLTGNAGADTLTGGAGDDVFVFVATTDSTALQSDLITDFTSGSDRIDLTAIDADGTLAGDQGFIFIDAAAFTGQAGELRLELAPDGSAVLSGDVDGDGFADLVIRLAAGSGAPVLADLLL